MVTIYKSKSMTSKSKANKKKTFSEMFQSREKNLLPPIRKLFRFFSPSTFWKTEQDTLDAAETWKIIMLHRCLPCKKHKKNSDK